MWKMSSIGLQRALTNSKRHPDLLQTPENLESWRGLLMAMFSRGLRRSLAQQERERRAEKLKKERKQVSLALAQSQGQLTKVRRPTMSIKGWSRKKTERTGKPWRLGRHREAFKKLVLGAWDCWCLIINVGFQLVEDFKWLILNL